MRIRNIVVTAVLGVLFAQILSQTLGYGRVMAQAPLATGSPPRPAGPGLVSPAASQILRNLQVNLKTAVDNAVQKRIGRMRQRAVAMRRQQLTALRQRALSGSPLPPQVNRVPIPAVPPVVPTPPVVPPPNVPPQLLAPLPASNVQAPPVSLRPPFPGALGSGVPPRPLVPIPSVAFAANPPVARRTVIGNIVPGFRPPLPPLPIPFPVPPMPLPVRPIPLPVPPVPLPVPPVPIPAIPTLEEDVPQVEPPLTPPVPLIPPTDAEIEVTSITKLLPIVPEEEITSIATKDEEEEITQIAEEEEEEEITPIATEKTEQIAIVKTLFSMLEKPMKRRVICVFNNENFYNGGLTPDHIDPKLCTHINYEFAILNETTYLMDIGLPNLDIKQNFYKEVVQLKDKNSHLKVILSLGGWNDSTKKYSTLIADEDKRQAFIDDAIPMLEKYGFDGLDVAFEYPNAWQGDVGVNKADKPHFVKFLQDLRDAFDEKDLLLSISVSAVKEEIEAAYDVLEIAAVVDFINVMTYDMHGPWEGKTGHHAQFFKLPEDVGQDEHMNVHSAMDVWMSSGAPSEKLNLGIPAYGHSYTLANPEIRGLGVHAPHPGNAGPVTQQSGLLSFNEICKYLTEDDWEEVYDPLVGPYAFKDDQWVCYDSPTQAAAKCKYAVEAGFGGVMLKDISGDDYDGACFDTKYPLLKAIKTEMEKASILTTLL